MSEGHTHDQEHLHVYPAPAAVPFRFEFFADAPSAQAAFEALYPSGSSIEPALRTLVEMGAQCQAVSPTTVACRYVEKERAMAGMCWYVSLERNNEKVIQRITLKLAISGL